jgi:hypothetical protein
MTVHLGLGADPHPLDPGAHEAAVEGLQVLGLGHGDAVEAEVAAAPRVPAHAHGGRAGGDLEGGRARGGGGQVAHPPDDLDGVLRGGARGSGGVVVVGGTGSGGGEVEAVPGGGRAERGGGRPPRLRRHRRRPRAGRGRGERRRHGSVGGRDGADLGFREAARGAGSPDLERKRGLLEIRVIGASACEL